MAHNHIGFSALEMLANIETVIRVIKASNRLRRTQSTTVQRLHKPQIQNANNANPDSPLESERRMR